MCSSQQLYTNVVKLAKSKGVKISYKNTLRKTMLDNYSDYLQQIGIFNKHFEIVKQYAERIKERKLRYGTSDDIVLKEMLEYALLFETIHYRNNPYTIVKESMTYLKETFDKLSNAQLDGITYYKIYL